MQAVAQGSQPDWHPAHVDSEPYDSSSVAEGSPSISSSDQPLKRPGPTIRQIRESMSVPDRLMQAPQTISPPPPPPRKKASIFGGLFATKEPTQLALNQFQAHLIAQHGSTKTAKVPNVSMEKMPEHVPKVNSKWDGVPDTIKERERREKEKQKGLKRQSVLSSSSSQPWSAGSFDRRGRRGLRSANSSSRPTSTCSRGMSSYSYQSDPRSPNPHKFYAQSVNSSGDLASQQRTDQAPEPSSVSSQCMRSPSAVSLPSITTSAPEDVAPPPSIPSIPSIYRSSLSTRSRQSDAVSVSQNSKGYHPSLYIAPPSEVIPEHTTSPIATPSERSPVTPSTQQTHEPLSSVCTSVISSPGGLALESSGPNVLPFPVSTKKKSIKPSGEAFLAGEARPLELPDEDEDEPQPVDRNLPLRQWGHLRGSLIGNKAPAIPSRSIDRVAQNLSNRPDSSRSRLGLKANMLVRTDAAPWEVPDNLAVLNPRSANAGSRVEPSRQSNTGEGGAKRFLPALDSLRKKES